MVPSLRSVEITNAVLMAEPRKRVKQPEIRRFVELLDELTVIMDSQSVTESVSNILPIARGNTVFLPTTLPIWMWRYGMGCRWPLSTTHCKKQVGRPGSRYSRAALVETRANRHQDKRQIPGTTLEAVTARCAYSYKRESSKYLQRLLSCQKKEPSE